MATKAKPGYKLELSNFKQFEEIPEDWNLKTLDDVGKIVGGGTPSTTIPEYWDGDILWATPSDLVSIEGNFIDDTERKITQQGLDESSAKLIEPGNLIFSSRATIGECKINTKPISTNQGFQNIIPNSSHDPTYVFYAILQNQIKFIRFAYGTTFLEISKDNVKKIKIAFPNAKNEESKIGIILSNIDHLLASYRKILKQNKKIKQGFMQQLLIKGISHTKFKKVDWLFGKEIEIPEDWEQKKLKDIVSDPKTSFSMGPFGSNIKTENYVSQGVPIIRGINLNNDVLSDENFVFLTEQKADELSNSNAFQNDVLMTSQGTVGEISIIPKNSQFKRYVLSQNLMKITPDEKIVIPFFIYYYLQSTQFQNELLKNIYGLGVPAIAQPLTTFRNMCIIFPKKIHEQEKIVSILSKIDSNIKKITSKNQQLEFLKKGLMQKLLTGQIRVTP